MRVTILDFDLTLTKVHTFQYRQLTDMSHLSASDVNYELGKTDAVINLKDGVKELSFFNLEGEDSVAIATHHNNPDYIAGYMAAIFGKEVRLIDEKSTDKGSEIQLAMRTYAIEGSDKQFRISYIPAAGPAFDAARGALYGKNLQILQLITVTTDNLEGTPIDYIDYYDDDPTNIERAQEDFTGRKEFAAHLVTGGSPSFFDFEYGKRILRETGVVDKITPAAALILARETGKLVLRESASRPGEIVVVFRNGIESILPRDYIGIEDPGVFSSKERILEAIESKVGYKVYEPPRSEPPNPAAVYREGVRQARLDTEGPEGTSGPHTK